ncbi:MAG: hypothetical protein WB676_20055 [Bryobacteraceae bacterium]
MAYEIFEKKATRIGTPAVTFSSKDRLSINAAGAKIFHQIAVESVLLLWDREHHRAAIRPITKKDSRAYKVTYGLKANGVSFSARSFLNHIGWQSKEKFTVPATWNEEQSILEFELPADKLKNDRQPSLLMVEPETRRKTKMG